MGSTQSAAALTETRGGPAPAGQHLYVGIDIGRRTHVVAVIPQARMENDSWEKAQARRISTTVQGFKEMSQLLAATGIPPDLVRVGCEPTGGWYGLTAAAWLERQGYEVSWLQNWAIHDQRELMIGKQTKTDALDARLIARLLYERDYMGRNRGFLQRPPRSCDALRMLVRNRANLVQQRTRYRLQLTGIEDVLFPELKEFFKTSITGTAARKLLGAFPTPSDIAEADAEGLYQVLVVRGRMRKLGPRLQEFQEAAAESAGLTEGIEPILSAQDWLLCQLDRIDEQVASVEEAIAIALDSWPADERAVMESLPGITTVREAVLFSAIGNIDGYRDDRQLRKMLGWYAEAKESGSSVSKHHLGHSGNRMARREIWLWSMQLLTPSARATPFRAYYQRLRDRGMPGQVAIGHLAGKLISVLFYCLRYTQPYDPDRHARALGLVRPAPTADVVSAGAADAEATVAGTAEAASLPGGVRF